MMLSIISAVNASVLCNSKEKNYIAKFLRQMLILYTKLSSENEKNWATFSPEALPIA